MSLLREFRRGLATAKPAHVEPCLPSTAAAPPPGPDWLHEIKHDGYRMMVRRDASGVRILTRNGHDWSGRYPLKWPPPR
jgi:ATP-dependent DNA ligase